MSCCAIANCPNYTRKTRKLGVDVIYHTFPKNDITLSNLWIKKCKRLDSINYKNARICSDHFQPSDYIDDMKNRLLNLPQKKILSKSAVPTLKLPRSTVAGPSSRNSGRHRRGANRRSRGTNRRNRRARASGRTTSLESKKHRNDSFISELGQDDFVTMRDDNGSDHRKM